MFFSQNGFGNSYLGIQNGFDFLVLTLPGLGWLALPGLGWLALCLAWGGSLSAGIGVAWLGVAAQKYFKLS